MKKLVLIFSLSLMAIIGFTQKFAYVDTKYILESIPDYKEAQETLNRLSEEWQQEVEVKYGEIDKLYRDFQAEKILLTEEMKQRREEEIILKEKEAKALQQQRFGVDGDLFKKREEFIKPIQDKIYKAIKEISINGSYSIVFDKANQSNILFANEKYDKSNSVLKKMGYSPN